MRLPQSIGPVTLTRVVGTTGGTTHYIGQTNDIDRRPITARQLHPFLADDPARIEEVRRRAQDLRGVSHPSVLAVHGLHEGPEGLFVIEERQPGWSVAEVISLGREHNKPMPPNVFLKICASICDALDALHQTPGAGTGDENVLHLALRPEAVTIHPDGKASVGLAGLVRSPTALPSGDAAGNPLKELAYSAPEQTRPDDPLGPSTDLFAFASLIGEMLTGHPLFARSTAMATIQAIRAADIGDGLRMAQAALPGMEKVLYRALSANTRHRYQRAFVLREDLRGLMASYSFAQIEDDLRLYFRSIGLENPSLDEPLEEDPETTMSYLKKRLVDSVQQELDDEAVTETRQEISEAPPPPRVLTPPPAMSLPPPQEKEDTTLSILRRASLAPSTEQEVAPEPVADDAPGFEDLSDVLEAYETNATSPGIPPAMETPDDSTVPPQLDSGSDPDEDALDISGGTLFEVDPTAPMEEVPVRDAAPLNRSESPPPQHAEPPPMPPSPDFGQLDDDDDLSYKSGSSRGLLYGLAGAAVIGLTAAAALVVWTIVSQMSDSSVVGDPNADATQVAEAPASPKDGKVPVEAPESGDSPSEDAASTPSPPPATTTSGDDVGSRPTPTKVASADVQTAPRTKPRRTRVPGAESTTPRSRPDVERTVPTPDPTPIPDPTPKEEPVIEDSLPDFDIPDEPIDDGSDGVSEEIIETVERPQLSLDTLAIRSRQGNLSTEDRQSLMEISQRDPMFTRASVLLYEDAKARGDGDDQRKFIDRILQEPSNRYDPKILAEAGQLDIEDKRYDSALERANLAERHWARLPPSLVFTRKAMIYEIQAAAWQGLFYRSGGSDADALRQAIEHWEKYERHVLTRNRTDLKASSDKQLARLNEAKRRLE